MSDECVENIEKAKENVKAMLERFTLLLGRPDIMGHVRWLVTINAGALIWLLSSIDKFCVDGKLYSKPFFITIICVQMFSVIMSFWLNMLMLKWVLDVNLSEFKYRTGISGTLDMLANEIKQYKKRLPSNRTAMILESIFGLSFVLLALYIILFIVHIK